MTPFTRVCFPWILTTLFTRIGGKFCVPKTSSFHLKLNEMEIGLYYHENWIPKIDGIGQFGIFLGQYQRLRDDCKQQVSFFYWNTNNTCVKSIYNVWIQELLIWKSKIWLPELICELWLFEGRVATSYHQTGNFFLQYQVFIKLIGMG